MNLGMFEKPDLYLIRAQQSDEKSNGMFKYNQAHHQDETINRIDPYNATSINNRIRSNELIFLNSSPDYCDLLPSIKHHGTSGRPCIPINNVSIKSETGTSKKNDTIIRSTVDELSEMNQKDSNGALGSCEELCCNRGYRSELELDMVTCNCRFKFCCQVECEYCLHQRMLHYCL